MMANPEVPITGLLRETLEKLRAVTDDEQLGVLMDAGQEHAALHTLVDTGVRGLDQYLIREQTARLGPRGTLASATTPSRRKSRKGSRLASSKKALTPARFRLQDDLELAERSLAVIDATLSCAAQCPDYESSLAVQEGLSHIRRRIHAAVECLGERGHRGDLESLRESLCRELRLRSSPADPK